MGDATMTMEEKRKAERCKIDKALDVVDIHSERQLGRVVDLSVEGPMMISDVPVGINRIFEVTIPLPMDMAGCREIRLGVESLWTRESNDRTQHWTGFHVIALSDADRSCIEELISHL